KALRSLEIGVMGLEAPELPEGKAGDEALWRMIDQPRPRGRWRIAEAFRRGATIDEISRRSAIDPWFLRNLQELVEMEAALAAAKPAERVAWLRPGEPDRFSHR